MPSPVPSLPHLTPEQEAYTRKWSLSAFALSFIYCLASGLIKEAFLLLVPVYNVYLYFKLIVKGKRLSWEKGDWRDFETFRTRQRLLDRISVAWLIVWFVLLVGGGTLVFYSTKAPTEAAESIFLSLAQGQVKRAYQETTPAFQTASSLEEFAIYVRRYPELNNLESLSLTSRDVSTDERGTHATLSGKLVTRQGLERPIIIYMNKLDGQWRLQGFNIINPDSERTRE